MTDAEYFAATGKHFPVKVLENSGNGGIMTLEGCKDFDELGETLSGTYNIALDNSVRSLDFETVQTIMPGVQSMLDEFPELAQVVSLLSTDASENGIMACTGDAITLHPMAFRDKSKLLSVCRFYADQGEWVKNSSPASLGVHECTHGLEWVLIRSNKSYMYDFQRTMAWNDCTEAKKIVIQACKNVRKTSYGKGKRDEELIESISRYATKLPSEAMAEAFADVYANGNKANPLSMEIRKLTVEALKKIKGGHTP